MKYLLVIAHGSRRADSNDEIRTLVNRLRASNTPFQQIDCAFLEIEEPSIVGGLRACIDAGAQDIVVMPYFLSAGRHVVTDIPEQVEIIQAEYPQVGIRIAPYLGASDKIDQILVEQACEAI